MLKEVLEQVKETLIRFFTSRLLPVGILFFVFFVILVVRHFDLQIMHGEEYYDNYIEITQTTVTEDAPRGCIYDRNGVVLAYNEITYSVTIKDVDVYTGKGELSSMVYRLVLLLERFDAEIESYLPVVVNEYGVYEYSGTETRVRQFIRDTYGLTTSQVEKMQQEGDDPYSYSAEKVMEYIRNGKYKFSEYLTGKNGLADDSEITKQQALDIFNIRYALAANSYKKYVSAVVCKDVSAELQAAVMEHADELQGVEIEEDTVRVYPYAECFSHVLGYTGTASEEELEILQEEDDTYETGDIIGKQGTGLEWVMETTLSGQKGTQIIYKDSTGLVLDTEEAEEPVPGDDVYLSLDAELTQAVYNIIEEQLAGIVYDRLIQGDFTPTEDTLAEEFKIPIKDVYFQMINNNVLSCTDFADTDASQTEKNIQAKYEAYYAQVTAEIRNELLSAQALSQNVLSDELKGYMEYIYTFLTKKNMIISGAIDTTDGVYQAWKEGTIGLREFLLYGIENQWIDYSLVETQEQYSTTNEMLEALVGNLLELLAVDDGFAKELYDVLIHQQVVTGCEICIALMEQGVLTVDEAAYEKLQSGDEDYAYEFMREKIYNIEITPAQIALDPCSGSAVITDVDTGELLAVVTYPGYDINRLSGTIDAEYYRKLVNDLSQPFYNRATQTRLSPGSTYKMLTGIAGVLEGVIGKDELVDCQGVFEPTNQQCWIFREHGGVHGNVDLLTGLANSCNCYFFEIGYRLSLDEDGNYNQQQGLEKLAKYASMFGFDENTGIEIRENISHISDEYPVSSAIGQGTNNFTCLQMGRYIEAIASRGSLYQYTLLDKITDYTGELKEDITPEVERTIELPEDLWDDIWEGMYQVLQTGSAAGMCNDIDLEIVGKTGTTQENKLRGNHGNFTSFAPKDDPEISVEVMLPNAYTSGNAIYVAKDIYRYYFGLEAYEDIVDGHANAGCAVNVGD